MTFNDIVSIIANNGMSIVIIAYLIFRDYTFNIKLEDLLTELNTVVKALEKTIEKEKGDN